ncbi:MAG: OadG family protein [Anaerolineales bacterium]|nr:OadG family protein [Anaerolineales bacterium]
MPPNLIIALQITAIGMGLVFGALVLFWGLMAAIVRLTADPAPAPDPAPAAADPAAAVPVEPALRAQAAALAVAVALAEAEMTSAPTPPFVPPPTGVSVWQAVMRANQLNQRGPVR